LGNISAAEEEEMYDRKVK